MWPFTANKQELKEDEQERVRKRLQAERRAYRACLKANKGDPNSCTNLEHRLLERWAEMVEVCKLAAEDYQTCYTHALSRKDWFPPVQDVCSPEIKKMKDCLQKLGVNPLT